MALTHPLEDNFNVMNREMSRYKGPVFPNMTMVPEISKTDTMSLLVPQSVTAGDMTGFSASGAPMTIAAGTPTRLLSAPTYSPEPPAPTNLTTDMSKAMPTINSADFDIWKGRWGATGNNQKDYDRYIKMAGYAKMGAAGLKIASAVSGALQYTDLRKDVEATKSQYELQKTMIDENIATTESALMEGLMENMATLDVMSAAKNVDLSSSAVQGQKEKGAMDLGEDVARMTTQGNLNKAALDLQYAMNVQQAKQNEINAYVGAGMQIAGTALMLL